jgi:hypothetical protein
MQGVTRAKNEGPWEGRLMTRDDTLYAAEVSQDRNPVHISDDAIAHGMNSASQLLAALEQDLSGSGLVPQFAEMIFRRTVPADGSGRIYVDSVPCSGTRERKFEVRFESERVSEVVLKATFALCEGHFTQSDWVAATLSAWRVSALVAETWPRCKLATYRVNFAASRDAPGQAWTVVLPLGRNERDQLRVGFITHAGDWSSPMAHGFVEVVLDD